MKVIGVTHWRRLWLFVICMNSQSQFPGLSDLFIKGSWSGIFSNQKFYYKIEQIEHTKHCPEFFCLTEMAISELNCHNSKVYRRSQECSRRKYNMWKYFDHFFTVACHGYIIPNQYLLQHYSNRDETLSLNEWSKNVYTCSS